MGARIDWAPNGGGLVTCLRGVVRSHDARGRVAHDLASAHGLDVRWLDDGRIVWLDDRGALAWHRDGALVEQRDVDFQPRAMPPGRTDRIVPVAACLSANGECLVVVTELEVFAATTRGERTWKFPGLKSRVASAGVTSAALSAHGNLVAIGFNRRLPSQLGRGWIVIDLFDRQVAPRQLARSTSRSDTQQLRVRSARATHGHDRTGI
ncbi:MAG TPA: hypothetical protein VMJ10_14660 [Kofleriaceae bacterium]|nr:hypothetical protein [Kofleriaceae bacterium]